MAWCANIVGTEGRWKVLVCSLVLCACNGSNQNALRTSGPDASRQDDGVRNGVQTTVQASRMNSGADTGAVDTEPPVLEALAKACPAAVMASIDKLETVDNRGHGTEAPVLTRMWLRDIDPIYGDFRGKYLEFPGGTMKGRTLKYTSSPVPPTGVKMVIFVGRYGSHPSPCSGTRGMLALESGTSDGRDAGTGNNESAMREIKARIQQIAEKRGK